MIMDPFGGKTNEILESEVPFPHRNGVLYNIQYMLKLEVNGVKASNRNEIGSGLCTNTWHHMFPRLPGQRILITGISTWEPTSCKMQATLKQLLGVSRISRGASRN